MVLSIAVVVVIMLLAVGATGLCTYGRDTAEHGPVQVADAAQFLSQEARSANHEVRLPEVPDGWVCNSARRRLIGEESLQVVGWLTPDQKGYVQLTQTGLPTDQIVAKFDQYERTLSRTETRGGHEVGIYSGTDKDIEDLWVVDLPGERLVFSGVSRDQDMRTIIDATLAAQPLA